MPSIDVGWNVSGDLILSRHGDEGLCWGGVFSKLDCCNVTAHGENGNSECWSEGYDFDRCCVTPMHVQEEKAHKDHLQSAFAVSQKCWRLGFTFKNCCTRSRKGGNPECWDGAEFTFEKCCQPPESLPAALHFEDINCDRAGLT